MVYNPFGFDMAEKSPKISPVNPRIKYPIQHKDGNAYMSLNNIHDEDTAVCQQSQARNASLNSQPNHIPASSISETTKEVAGRTDRCSQEAEEAAKSSLGATASHHPYTQSWKEQPVLSNPQPVLGYPQPFALDTTMTHYPSYGNGTPEAPVGSNQSGQRKRGRPQGSKNKPKPDPSAEPPEKRRRGRPLGAKNKPKLIGLAQAEAAGAYPTPSPSSDLSHAMNGVMPEYPTATSNPDFTALSGFNPSSNGNLSHATNGAMPEYPTATSNLDFTASSGFDSSSNGNLGHAMDSVMPEYPTATSNHEFTASSSSIPSPGGGDSSTPSQYGRSLRELEDAGLWSNKNDEEELLAFLDSEEWRTFLATGKW